ncbi:MAG: tetratricopeptide repeat protein [Candidatus Helarchaeota archaeon]|nr:tetratricopeptide repeat protein [Candidatus Helarchaeota archaeon]
MEDDAIYLGEDYSLSIILRDGRIAGFRDNIFKKQFEIDDEFESLRKIEISESVIFDAVSDKKDRIKVLSPFPISLGLPVKVLTQSLGVGTRRIEVFQGQTLGKMVMRTTFNIKRSIKWKIMADYEQLGSKSVQFPQKVSAEIYSTASAGFETNYFYFALPEGFSQVILFFSSELDFERIGKNMLILDSSDPSFEAIAKSAPDGEKFFPLLTFTFMTDYKNKKEELKNQLIIGSILTARGKYELALEYLDKALKISRKIQDSTVEAEILLKMGSAFEDSGQLEDALQCYQSVSSVYHAAGNTLALISNYLTVGSVLERIGRYDEALEYYNEVYNSGAQDPKTVLKGISRCLVGIGRSDEAVDIRRQLLDDVRTARDREGESAALMDLGEVLLAVGRMGEAMSMFEQAIRIRKGIGDERGIAESLESMGEALFRRGKLVKAKDYYEKAIEEYENIGLLLESARIKEKKLRKITTRPYSGCEVCAANCSLEIMGLSHADINDPIFREQFKKILRTALSRKDLNPVAELLLEKAQTNILLRQTSLTPKQYAYCLFIHAGEEILGKLKPEYKRQIEKLVSDSIRRIPA